MADGTIRGDESHPANRGRLCSKGSALAETLDDSERLTVPLVNHVPTTWHTALDLIASRFSETIATYGPDSVAFYLSGQCLTEDYYVANKLMKGFIGSGNIDTNSRLCMASSVAGHVRAFGEDMVPGVYADWDDADLVVLVGSNTAWCHPVLYQRLLAARAARGTRIVVIDPRRTATAGDADLHLQLAPGSDVLLFNGLLAHLASTGAVNKEWIARHTAGFADALAAADPQSVAEGCDLDPRLLEKFYDWFASTERTLSAFSQGVNQSFAGTDKVNAIINCHLATGRIGRPGMGPFSITGQPNAMGGREVGGLANQLAAHLQFDRPGDHDKLRRFWCAPRLASRPGLKAVDLFDAVLDSRVKALWIVATNPAASMPRADRVRAALDKCPFLVVSDCWPTDTTRHAHVVLPAAGWGEKDGTVTNSERCISRQRQFRRPPGKARPDWWMFTEVARRMGFADAFAWDGPAAIFREHAALSGFENHGERVFNIATAAPDGDDYDAMAPRRWPREARLFANGGFSTPDQRARFVPTPYRAQPPTRPFVLNTGRVRDQWHTMTRTGRVPRLMTHTPEPTVTLNPADAATLGLAQGDLAHIETDAGNSMLRVALSDGQRRGEVFAPMHWTDAFASVGSIGRAVTARLDRDSGQPELKLTPASISRVAARFHALLLRRAGGPLAAQCHWTRVVLATGHLYRLAGDEMPGTKSLFGGLPERAEYIEMEDVARGVRRCAALVDNVLDACVFVARDPAALPTHDAIASLLGTVVPDNQRRLLLAFAGARVSANDSQLVCVCFGVSRSAICRAVHQHGLRSARDIGARLNAGTNCGSCLPELQAILREGETLEWTH
jgi:assimilatory nitrate reductase catalytic subunit